MDKENDCKSTRYSTDYAYPTCITLKYDGCILSFHFHDETGNKKLVLQDDVWLYNVIARIYFTITKARYASERNGVFTIFHMTKKPADSSHGAEL